MLPRIIALIVRSLRLDVRQIRWHLLRGSSVGMTFFSLLIASFNPSDAPGLTFFYTLTVLNMLYVTLAGGFYFASSLTAEKEDQTLALLMLTGIEKPALLLGVFLPRVYLVMVLIAIQIPFSTLSITLGGITFHQVLASYLMLLTHAMYVGGLGLLASTICRRTSTAMMLTFGLMLFFSTGVYWLEMLFEESGLRGLEQTMAFIQSCQAFGRINKILSTDFGESMFSQQVFGSTGLAVVTIMAAWLLFSRYVRDSETVSAGSSRPAKRSLSPGPGSNPSKGSRRAWDQALAWKDFQFMCGGKNGLLVHAVSYPLIAFIIGITHNQNSLLLSLALSATWVGIAAAWLEAIIQSSRFLRAEVQAQTWSSLLLLPTDPLKLVMKKSLGWSIGLLPALVVAVLGGLGVLLDSLHKGELSQVGPQEVVIFGTAIVGGVLQLYMMSSMVAFFSLSMSSPLALLLSIIITTFCSCNCGPTLVFGFAMAAQGNQPNQLLSTIIGGLMLVAITVGISVGLNAVTLERLRKAVD